MKIKHFEDKKGELKVQIECLNDLWVLFNVIYKDDKTISRTTRRIILREGDSGDRKPMILTLEVKDVAFHEYSNRLRIKGIILSGPEDLISFGSYHTFNVSVGSIITIIKKKWMKHDLSRIEKSSKVQSFRILIIAIESGLATVAIISDYSQKIITSIKHNIPGKRYEKTLRNKEIGEFFGKIDTIIADNLERIDINLIIITGPGGFKEKYTDILKKSRPSLAQKIKIINSSSATFSAIKEVIKSKKLEKIKKTSRIIYETNLMDKFIEQLGKDTKLVSYGWDHIKNAALMGAIDILLISDKLLRGLSFDKRSELEDTLNIIEKKNGKIEIFSSEHSAGEQLISFGSIAAILRFKI